MDIAGPNSNLVRMEKQDKKNKLKQEIDIPENKKTADINVQ